MGGKEEKRRGGGKGENERAYSERLTLRDDCDEVFFFCLCFVDVYILFFVCSFPFFLCSYFFSIQ